MRKPQTSTARTVVARNIKAELVRRGMRPQDLCPVLRVTAPGVSRRLSGQTAMDIDEVFAVARYLGVPVGSLFLGVDEAVAA